MMGFTSTTTDKESALDFAFKNITDNNKKPVVMEFKWKNR